MDTRPPLPTELQVEVTGACNFACKMCLVRYRPKLGKAEGAMPFGMFKAIVDRRGDAKVRRAAASSAPATPRW